MNKGLKVKLSDDSVFDLERILKDIRVLRLLVMDDNKSIAQKVTVRDDGVIIFGKNRWEWVNWLFGENEKIGFIELSMNLIQIFSNTVDGDIPEEKRAKNVISMAKEWFEAVLTDGDWDQAVRLLFYCYYIGFRNPKELAELKTQPNNKGKGEKIGDVNYVLLRTGLGLMVQDFQTGNFYNLTKRK